VSGKATDTTNTIESVNSTIREASRRRTKPISNWKEALIHFAIAFEDRLPKHLG